MTRSPDRWNRRLVFTEVPERHEDRGGIATTSSRTVAPRTGLPFRAQSQRRRGRRPSRVSSLETSVSSRSRAARRPGRVAARSPLVQRLQAARSRSSRGRGWAPLSRSSARRASTRSISAREQPGTRTPATRGVRPATARANARGAAALRRRKGDAVDLLPWPSAPIPSSGSTRRGGAARRRPACHRLRRRRSERADRAADPPGVDRGGARGHGLSGSRGLPELREAIAAWAQRRLGAARLDPEREMIPTLGSKEAIFSFAQVAWPPTAGGTPWSRYGARLPGARAWRPLRRRRDVPALPLLEARTRFLPDLDAVDASVWERLPSCG